MYNEMDERNPDVFMRITVIAFAVLFFVYSAFSVIGYLGYGATASSNILSNLPFDSDEYGGDWGKASRISFLVVIVAAYPIFLYPMISSLRNSDVLRQHINNEDPLNDPHNTRRRLSPALLSGVATVLIVFTAMVAALFIKDLGFINVVVGAVQCAIFVGVCPSLVGIFLFGDKSESSQWRFLMVMLMVLCCLLGFVGLIFTKNYAGEVTANCKWLIFHGSSRVALAV
jgi:amino acid permease